MTDDADGAARRLRLLGGIAEARDADMAQEAMDRLMAELGLGPWGFAGHVLRPGGTRIDALAGTGSALVGIRAYDEAGLAEGDPMFRALHGGQPWVTGTQMFRDPTPRGPADRRDAVVRLLRRHRVANIAGFAIDGPRGDVGFLSTAVHSDEEAAALDGICDRHHALLRLAGTAFAAKLAGFGRKAPLLTDAERDVLERLACGERPDEIASALGKSVRTVRHQIESARQRLGASTTVSAVALALELGEIAPPPDRL